MVLNNERQSFWGRVHDDYMEFGGRINRMQFAIRFLTLFIVRFVFGIVVAAIDQKSDTFGAVLVIAAMLLLLFGVAVGFMLLVAYIAIFIKRLHDLNISGWWLLLLLAAEIGIAVYYFPEFSILNDALYIFFFFVLFCFPGNPGPNKYGDPPHLEREGDEDYDDEN